MAAHRIFASCENASAYESGASVEVILDSDTLHHVTRVLRLRVGETVEVILKDSWNAYEATVQSVSKEGLRVHVQGVLPTAELPAALDLFWGYAKGDKNDRIVRQATEIGCRRFTPVRFQRSEIKIDGAHMAKKIDRFTAIATSAAAQAHRSIIPQISSMISSDELAEVLASYDACLIAWEQDNEKALSQVADEVIAQGARTIALVIGPEGGIAPSEIARLQQQGAQTAHMGRTILRVETACSVACGIVADRIRSADSDG